MGANQYEVVILKYLITGIEIKNGNSGHESRVLKLHFETNIVLSTHN